MLGMIMNETTVQSQDMKGGGEQGVVMMQEQWRGVGEAPPRTL